MKPGSKISTTLVVSVALVGAVGVRPRAPLFAEEATHVVSPELRHPLKEAQDDLASKKYAEAISKLKAAEAIQGRAPYDQHVINDLLAYAYVKTRNYPDAAKTMEMEVDDGFTPAADQPKKVRDLAVLNYQLKDYDKAIGYGQRAIKGGHGEDEMQTLVGQAYYLKEDWKGTLDFGDQIVTGQIKRGQTPAKPQLQLIYSACVKLHNNECAMRALDQLKRYYPGTDPVAPQAPVGTLLAYFFGPAEDVGSHKHRPASQDDSKKTN